MDASAYRKKYAEYQERVKEHRERQAAALEDAGLAAADGGPEAIGFAEAAPPADEGPLAEALDVMRDQGEDADLRAVTLHAVANDIGKREDLLTMVLDLLKSSDEPTVLRLEALRTLQALSFSSTRFNAIRPDYIAALRGMVDVEDATLRQRVLEVLAQMKDEYVQRRLLEGLQDPSKALVPPDKAIQLLGYDVHADYFPTLREIARKPPSAAAQREAVRMLAADPESRELLTDILNDKKKNKELRRISAISLQSLAPQTFKEHARKIVLDEDEDDDLLATSIGALAQSEGPEALSQDTEVSERVEQLHKGSASKAVEQSAARYIAKKNG